MKVRDRNRLMRMYGSRYKRDPELPADKCAYCGDIRETINHCPPIKWSETLLKSQYKYVLYPSCLMCNLMLGDKALFSYQERLSHLYTKYLTKVEKINGMWTEKEIKELGYSLQNMVRSKVFQDRIVIRKLHGVEERLLDLGT